MSDSNSMTYKRQYGDHEFMIIADYEPETKAWTILAQCMRCRIHLHQVKGQPIVADTGKTIMTLMDIEMQMHASGITEGWTEGLVYEDVVRDA